MRRWLLCVAACLATIPAAAIDPGGQFDDPALTARYDKLAHELRCLQCQNQTIADSPSLVAEDLRRSLRRQLLEGRTDAEILDFMVARYGDFVRYRPAWSAKTWLLWLAPFIFLAGGVIVAARVIRRNAALPIDDDRDDWS